MSCLLIALETRPTPKSRGAAVEVDGGDCRALLKQLHPFLVGFLIQPP